MARMSRTGTSPIPFLMQFEQGTLADVDKTEIRTLAVHLLQSLINHVANISQMKPQIILSRGVVRNIYCERSGIAKSR